MKCRFDKNCKTEQSPFDELYEKLVLTEKELENWKEILEVYNLKYLALTEAA